MTSCEFISLDYQHIGSGAHGLLIGFICISGTGPFLYPDYCWNCEFTARVLSSDIYQVALAK